MKYMQFIKITQEILKFLSFASIILYNIIIPECKDESEMRKIRLQFNYMKTSRVTQSHMITL